MLRLMMNHMWNVIKPKWNAERRLVLRKNLSGMENVYQMSHKHRADKNKIYIGDDSKGPHSNPVSGKQANLDF